MPDMILRYAMLLAMAPVYAVAQSPCPSINFLSARTVNLKPSATTHIDVVRGSNGTYTGFEVTDAAPFRTIATTPVFGSQFETCLPTAPPNVPPGAPPNANPPGAGSQLQVSTTFASGHILVANVSPDNLRINFNTFDSGHNFLSQTSFTPPSNPTYPSQILYSLALADLNGDGKLDLIASFVNSQVASSSVNSGVWVFLGNGDGTFQAGKTQVLATGPPAPALSFAIGDLNGDGKPDIVLGASDQPPQPAFYIALGNGDGTFNPQTLQLAVPSAFFGGLVSVAIADLNGDGTADLALSSDSNISAGANVAVMLGNGNGTFQTAKLYTVSNAYPANGIATAAVAVGDVNGDGIPDIVTAGGSILFGDGKGGFPSRRDYASSAAGSVMLADFNGDGITDIIIGNGNADFLSGTEPYANYSVLGTSDPSLTVLLGAGGGAFTGAPVSDIGGGESLAAADFNGDGIPDLAVTSGAANSVSVLKGKGDGSFSSVFTYTFASGYIPAKVVAADFNHDGKPDLGVLVGFTSAGVQGIEVEIFPGNGDGTFGAPLSLPVAASSVNFMAAPDVNGDGIPDLVVTSTALTNSLLVWLGKGDGTFSGPVFEQDGGSPAVAFGDFNGDGKLDIAVTYLDTDTLTVLLGNGDGTFPNSVSSMLYDVAGGGPNTLVAADFNGDGRLDLAVILPMDHTLAPLPPQIAVMTGQGNGAFLQSQLSPATVQTIFAADVNGDKLTDLVAIVASGGASGGVPGGASVLAGNGDGTFQPAVPIVSLPFVLFPAIADFNGDGLPDIALTATGFGVAAFLNLSQPPPPLTVVSAASFAPGPLAPNSFASAFGEGISIPEPGLFSPIQVTVQDSTGAIRPATEFFASEVQVNFLVPAATATGPATVTVNTTSGKQLVAQTQIAAVAPTLFSVGADIAVAYAVVVTPYEQSIEPVYFLPYPSGPTGGISAAPLRVDFPGGQTYLILFGTGFDAATAASTTVSVQGVTLPVSYAGPQPSIPGLDQVNVLLPPLLAGTGVATVSISVGGMVSNQVFVTIGPLN